MADRWTKTALRGTQKPTTSPSPVGSGTPPSPKEETFCLIPLFFYLIKSPLSGEVGILFSESFLSEILLLRGRRSTFAKSKGEVVGLFFIFFVFRL
jgi:hypothetical protein